MEEYVHIKLPYDKQSLDATVPKKNLMSVLVSKVAKFHIDLSEQEIVERSLDNPIGSQTLEELARGKKNIVIISSDHTRPLPSKIIMPILLKRIRTSAPKAKITILISTGFHRAPTKAELFDKYGSEIVENEKIVVHISTDDEAMANIGTLPSGGPCIINKLAVQADLLIAEGFIESHPFAGFSGGRKSVMPGVASYKTIMANHCGEFVNSPKAIAGNLDGNPIHADMLYAAKTAGLKFIVNVILDENKKIIASFAGDCDKAHVKGCEFLTKLVHVPKMPADITIATNGGYPLDQNIYQAVKGMFAAAASNKEGGVIIIVARCADGVGADHFYNNITGAKSPAAFVERCLNTPRQETVPEQWAAQIFANILVHHHVILVSDCVSKDLAKSLYMEQAETFDEALQLAFSLQGNEAKIVAIPDGVNVIVE